MIQSYRCNRNARVTACFNHFRPEISAVPPRPRSHATRPFDRVHASTSVHRGHDAPQQSIPTQDDLLAGYVRRRHQERADRRVSQSPERPTQPQLLTVWDGAAQYKSRIVRGFLESTPGAIQMDVLQAYSPDLNPVEHFRAWLDRHALAHFCPHSLTEPKSTAGKRVRSVQNRPSSPLAGNKLNRGDDIDYAKIAKQ
ncbi:MAG: hypothetical protein ACT4P0_03315 [Panacagrimonas sp.]